MVTLHSKESSRDHADAVAAAVSVPTSGDHGRIQQFRADTFSQPAEVTDSRHTTKTTQLQLQERRVIHTTKTTRPRARYAKSSNSSHRPISQTAISTGNCAMGAIEAFRVRWGRSNQEVDASSSANNSSTRPVLKRVGPSPTLLPNRSSSQN